MSDAPEIPEVTKPFDKRVALTIAILAVILSFVENLGDNAKTEQIIKTNAASNDWSYYQAKSVKGQMSNMHASLMSANAGTAASAEVTKEVERLKAEGARYDSEKSEIKVKAETNVKQAERAGQIDDRCDQSVLFLQVAIVMCSIAILSNWPAFWGFGILLGACGAFVGGLAFRM